MATESSEIAVRRERAFAVYASLPPNERSYAAVARKLGVSVPTVKRWGSDGGWRERLAEREAEVARKVANRAAAGQVDARTRQAKLVELGLIKLANAIAQGEIKGSFGDLDRLVRLDGHLKGTDKTMPVTAVDQLFQVFLTAIEQEIDEPEQRRRIASAIRRALDATPAAR